jgi:hypothetical protein
MPLGLQKEKVAAHHMEVEFCHIGLGKQEQASFLISVRLILDIRVSAHATVGFCVILDKARAVGLSRS